MSPKPQEHRYATPVQDPPKAVLDAQRAAELLQVLPENVPFIPAPAKSSIDMIGDLLGLCPDLSGIVPQVGATESPRPQGFD